MKLRPLMIEEIHYPLALLLVLCLYTIRGGQEDVDIKGRVSNSMQSLNQNIFRDISPHHQLPTHLMSTLKKKTS